MTKNGSFLFTSMVLVVLIPRRGEIGDTIVSFFDNMVLLVVFILRRGEIGQDKWAPFVEKSSF